MTAGGIATEERKRQTSSSATVPPLVTRKDRNRSVDALRGLVMIIMALDHTREFFHSAAMSFQPDDLSQTTTAIFFTRWITHICAPVFFFTTGIGAYFWLGRGHHESQTGYLVKRGLWLILLELTVLRIVTNFSLTNGPVLLTILWGLGCCMVALAFLAWLPTRVLAAGCIFIILLHNLTDSINADDLGWAAPLWHILHQPGLIPIWGTTVIVGYPLIPWVAVMALGLCFGPIMSFEPQKRQTWMVRLGVGMIVAFAVLRAVNIYGDPRPWTLEFPDKAWLSFLRCLKYPPSLDFLLMTLGPALLVLAWFDRLDFSRVSTRNPLLVFGRVPLFYFLLHFVLIHLLTIPFAYFRYGSIGFLRDPMPSLGGSSEGYPPDFGYELGVVYGIWILVVAIMYPLCLWFSRLKERRRDPWLSYL